jgi:predicted 3-demethylubiquinone-9 3-methyltransferase (glyoxalase superfamily)
MPTKPTTKKKPATQSPSITPFLWFDGTAEKAVKQYVSIFKGSRILHVSRYGKAGAGVSGRKAGSVMTVVFELNGQRFMALNGGPMFRFTEAVSFMVSCRTQAEVDHYWKRLSAGGEPGHCGWLKDRFGLSWQIIPDCLGELIGGDDPEGSQRAMEAMLQMGKLNLRKLKAAYASHS